ncbi:MAG: hypothetical protein R2699_19605 [Acidimicrobiales bacterium]
MSAIDSFAAVTDAPERSLNVVSRIEVGLDKIFLGQEQLLRRARPLPRRVDVSARPRLAPARRALTFGHFAVDELQQLLARRPLVHHRHHGQSP